MKNNFIINNYAMKIKIKLIINKLKIKFKILKNIIN